MHNRTLKTENLIKGRKKQEDVAWTYTTTKTNNRCERCDRALDRDDSKLCFICRQKISVKSTEIL